MLAENKDPSGGTAGRVKPYGRLGWMGARAEYSLRWGDDRSHMNCVAAGAFDVQKRFENF
jgi:hypothetical protein